jgi:uncharacterized protein YndB with AHSA1/START domain
MSIDITVETTINPPRATVAEYVTDPTNEPNWIRGIVESTPLAPGPIHKGSRVRRLAKFMGRQIDYTPEVIDLDPDRRLVMKTDKPFLMTIEYEFSERDGSTVFRQRLQGGPGGIMGLFSPLMASMVKRNVRSDMERLRTMLEDRGVEQHVADNTVSGV